MKKIICENNKKNKILFTYDFPYFLISVDGIYKVSGDVKTVSSAFGVGESYSGTSIKKRNIVISGIIKDNFKERRDFLYKMFPLKTEGTFYYYEDDIKRKISYEVEDIDVAEKGIPRDFVISLICPNPLFTDIEEKEISMATWSSNFSFPLVFEENEGIEFATKNITTMGVIDNDTNNEFGLIIKFTAHGHVKKPYLINVETQEKIQIDIDLQEGDKILITTQRGNKNIFYIQDSSTISQNINHLMEYGSDFLQVHSGKNTLRAGAEEDEGNLETNVFYLDEYEAV